MRKTEADYLSELIAFRSVSSDKEASKACAEFCAGFFNASGLQTKLIESDGYPNVIATSRNTKKPKVLLQCHMDVVPAKEPLFKMRQADGRLMGRGSFDMKFACASYMKIINDMGRDVAKYDFGIMLSFDEEIGGRNGVDALLKQGYSADICILPDSGKDWRLESSAHGAWFIKLSKKGKNAHASIPETGINAAEILLEVVAKVKSLSKKYPKEDLILSLTSLTSGKAMNQIPDYAEAVFDARFKNKDVYRNLKMQIKDICAEYEVHLATIELASCMNVESDAPGIDEFVEIAEKVIDRKIPRCHSLGTTDARYFCARGIPCIVIQPDGGGRHSDDEWVDHQGVGNLTEIIHRYIASYAKI
jgi:succinyl-diaminopimelate desuccinylase